MRAPNAFWTVLYIWLVTGLAAQAQPTVSMTPLFSCSGGSGYDPETPLIQGMDGNFYGSARSGGATGNGTLFKITPEGVFTVLHSFTGTDGSWPFGPLIQAPDGNLYGITENGGSGYWGTIFKMDTNGVFTNLYQFAGPSDPLGWDP